MRRTRARHVGRSVLSGATTPNRNGLVIAWNPRTRAMSGLSHVVAHKPALTKWTITSREDWRVIDRQACAGQFIHSIVHTAWRRGLIQRGVQNESDRGKRTRPRERPG